MSKITLEQVKEMFQMQDEMNKKVHPEWNKQGWDWHLAANMELMEGVDHYGWKWWKKQEPDLPQVQLEVVDAWHFWMSAYLEQQEEVYQTDLDWRNDTPYTYDVMCEEVYKFINEPFTRDLKDTTLKDLYFSLARDYENSLVSIEYWYLLLHSVELTPQDLYTMYVQKNVLNHFRQDHGYKGGTYIKEWFGEEDNVWLLRASKVLVGDNDFSRDSLYGFLESIYLCVTDGTDIPEAIYNRLTGE